MGICVLVASGDDFDVDEYLQDSPFKPSQVYHKGEIPAQDNPAHEALTESGFVVLISDSEYPEIVEQVIRALRRYEEELHELKDAGADNLLLDFGITEQVMLQRPHFLPPELITAMSRLEMGLVFSVIHT